MVKSELRLKETPLEDFLKKYYLVKDKAKLLSFLNKIAIKKEILYEQDTISGDTLKIPFYKDKIYIKLFKYKPKNFNKPTETFLKEIFYGDKVLTKLSRRRFNIRKLVHPLIVLYNREIFYLSDNVSVSFLSDIQFLKKNGHTELISSYLDKGLLEISKLNRTIKTLLKNVNKSILLTIPLHLMVYNELMEYYAKKSSNTPRNELKGIELETKFSVQNPAVYTDIYKFIKSGSMFPFLIENEFSHVLYRNLVISYLSKDKKVITGGIGKMPIVVVKKDKGSLIEDDYKILIRSEKKTTSEFLKILHKEQILKRKKVFWIKNQKNNRIYHISLDKEISPRHSLSQIEIEYAGILESRKVHKDCSAKIANDIAFIASRLNKQFIALKPTTKTKADLFYKK